MQVAFIRDSLPMVQDEVDFAKDETLLRTCNLERVGDTFSARWVLSVVDNLHNVQPVFSWLPDL
jgi:hypothetical protein